MDNTKDIIGWMFNIIYYRGGKTLLVTDDTGIEKLKIWADKGYVTEIEEVNNNRYMAEVVDTRFLTFVFKQKR